MLGALRIIVISYSNIISNNKWHKLCHVEPLSVRVDTNRWRMLGHVLCEPTEGPAYRAIARLYLILLVVNSAGQFRRKQTNRPSLSIGNDLMKKFNNLL